jgi:hypothetical protein
MLGKNLGRVRTFYARGPNSVCQPLRKNDDPIGSSSRLPAKVTNRMSFRRLTKSNRSEGSLLRPMMASSKKFTTPRCQINQNHLVRTNHTRLARKGYQQDALFALNKVPASFSAPQNNPSRNNASTALVAQGAAPFAGPEALVSCAHGVEKVELSPVNNVALFALNRVHRE